MPDHLARIVALVATPKRPLPPVGSFTVRDYMKYVLETEGVELTTMSAANMLEKAAEDGDVRKGKYVVRGQIANWYWPT